MKKNNRNLILILIQSLLLFYSCQPENKIPKLYVRVSGSPEHPVKATIGNFFPLGLELNLIDTSDINISYNFVPGEVFSINSDTTIRLFLPDSITIDYRFEKPVFLSTNATNAKYNQFYTDISQILTPVYQKDLIFLLDKKDSIVRDANYIDRYLTNSDSFTIKEVESLCSHYDFPKKITFDLLSSFLETKKLARSFFYLEHCIQKLDSLGTLEVRMQYYIDRINRQHISMFSQKDLSLLIKSIADQLIQSSIGHLKTSDDLQNYYSRLQHFFTIRSVSYDYLVSSLKVQAKKSSIKLKGSAFKPLIQDAKRSIFEKYVQTNYNRQSADLRDHSHDKNLYDTHFNSTDLSRVISQFENKPVVIDFWATWCLPCLKKIPEILEYKSKYPDLNILFISLDKSHDLWKLYLYEHNYLGDYFQYRRNYNNQDRIFNQILTIPKYGLLDKSGRMELFDELSDTLIKSYYKKY